MPLKTICLSHSPLIGLAKPKDRVEETVKAKLEELAEDIKSYDPEHLIVIGPDHFNGFYYDMMPPFCAGAHAEAMGDYGSPSGKIRTDEDFAVAFVETMGRENFDVTLSYRMQVDHGFAQPLVELTGSLDRYPTLPIFINAAAPPLAPCQRVRRFGEAIGRFALASKKRILIIGSGGLSHDPPIPSVKNAAPEVAQVLIGGRDLSPEVRKARQQRTIEIAKKFATGGSDLRELNDEWDRNFLNIVKSGNLSAFDDFSDASITQEAGRAGHEVRTWIAAFAAQSAAGSYDAEVLYQGAIPEWLVGMAIVRAHTVSHN